MNDLNLVVKMKLANGGGVQIKGAARIRVDGRGSLMLVDPQGGIEAIEVRQIEALSVQHLTQVQTAFAA